jgi:DNA polymerase elongation subunit (family B)
MFDSISRSIIGQSSFFESYFSYELERTNQFIKYNIVSENSVTIDKKDIKRLPKPKNTNIIINKEFITESEYKSVVGGYPGAYVKEINGCIKTEDDGLVIDLDASSMYPSQMMQYNMGFDTYFGFILDPICYNFLNIINKVIGTDQQYPEQISNDLCNIILKYLSDKHDKGKNSQLLYIILMDALYTLKEHNIPISKLFSQSNFKEYLLLKLYLLPLLETFIKIHPNSAEYNTFSYNYLINDEILHDNIFIVENAMNANIKINKIESKNIQDYLKTNNISINIAGTLFHTHEHNLGILYKFLENRLSMRSVYKKERNKFKFGSDEYSFNNHRQDVMKKNANSSYGLSGMKNFKFSSKNIASSITTCSRYCLKISQICAEMYINSLVNND